MWILREQDFKVCIDPGHGGSETGAVSPKGLYEKDLNLKFSLRLQEELNNLGLANCLTREYDQSLALQERVDICHNENAAFFISIHHNALPDGRDPNHESGFSCHYYKRTSKDFAVHLAKKLDDFGDIPSAGIYKQNLHVLRENNAQNAILLELGYLIHPEESEILVSDEFQEKQAKLIAKAIYNFRA